MRGTEKQIAWAIDIKTTLTNTWSEMKELLINDERFDPNNPQYTSLASKFDKNVAALETLNAYDIIDIFSNIDKSDNIQRRYKSIAACLIVSANPKAKLFIK